MSGNKLSQKNEAAFRARFEADNVAAMTKEGFDVWVDKLPIGEFMAMMSLRPEYSPPPLSDERRALCVALCGVAAFHLYGNSRAQKIVYRAVRELQRTSSTKLKGR